MSRYATIVADPPWEVKRSSNYRWREGRASGKQMALPYPTMTVDEIAALPVKDMAVDAEIARVAAGWEPFATLEHRSGGWALLLRRKAL